MGHSEKSAAMIQQTRSDPQNGKHSQTKEMMHTRAERKGRLMRNSKRSTLIGMCINVVFCAALLAGCGGGGSSSAGPADSNAAKQTVHEETVIHADPPVNPMFEAKFVLTGKTHEEWMSQVTNPAFTERTEVYDRYEHVIEEPVMLSVLPVSWNGGRILDLERIHEEKGSHHYQYGLNIDINFKDSDGTELNYLDDRFGEKAEALRKTHPEYQGLFWCELRFSAQDNDDYYYKRYLYDVEGDELVLTPVEYNFLDAETGNILFIEGAPQERFQYEFKDGKMVLRQGDCEASFFNEMEAYEIGNKDKKGKQNEWLISCEGISRVGYDMLDDISYIKFSKKDPKDHDKIGYLELIFSDGSRVTANSVWEDNNLSPGSRVQAESYGNYVRITWDKKDRQKEGEETPGELEFQYINLDSPSGVSGRSAGLILVRDGKVYQYNSNYDLYFQRGVANNYTEGSQELTETSAKKLLEKQKKVIERLLDAFKRSGIEVQVDEEFGTVRFDANILFEKASAELSEEGMEILDSFAEVYAAVMEEAVKDDLITTVMIDGYADPDGDYDYNLDLSQRRAEAVRSYCVEKAPSLEAISKAEGHSFDNLILLEDGSIDKDASRRVEFRFILKAD